LRDIAAGKDRPADRRPDGGAAAVQLSDSSSRILAGLLEARTGQQLTMNRRWRIETALAALLRERGIATLDELITILVMGKEPSLSQNVVEALLNNETYFFRDRAPFDLLQRYALPELAQRRGKTKRLRIWSAGCSTGQEVYSLAMLFAEDPEAWRGWTIDLLGSDVSTACIDRARAGTYTQFEVQRGLGINQMIQWFEECTDGWRAVEPLRKPVRFQVHNLLEPPLHPGGFDIVLCRNVLLYLSPDKKTLAFERLVAAMAEDGWLMLGAGETVIGQTSKLGADVNARGLYRIVGDGGRIEKRGGPDRRAAGGA
jgi:chemotaxis protein methyltransferase CheR